MDERKIWTNLVAALQLAHDHLAWQHEGPNGEPDEVLAKIRAALDDAEAWERENSAGDDIGVA